MSVDISTLRPGVAVRILDRDKVVYPWIEDLSSGGHYYEHALLGYIVSSDLFSEEFVIDEIRTTYMTAYLRGSNGQQLYTIFPDLIGEVTDDPYSSQPQHIPWTPYTPPRCDCGAWAVGFWHPHMPECAVADEPLLDIRKMISPPGAANK